MQKKWIFFKIISILLQLFTILIIAYLAYTLVFSFQELQAYNIIAMLCSIFLFTVICLFALLNIFILTKNYPDKFIDNTKVLLFNIFSVFYFIAIVLIFAIYSYGIFDTVKSFSENNIDAPGIEALIAFTIYQFCLIYILIQSIKLKKLIYKNAQLKALEMSADEKDILSSIIIEN